ncbi:dihydrodipicolinate synthase family protein [Phanerochaete sordida]|uniref:Dihydrodipicolinate synthase family protein n=1 Tax=Phanerochaete sordida TaxID=48140 RepID=A0A9P3LE90_9APHY|nr:dihydrodipicolinate synthase family protein [Phanerochaete sordida]
MTSRLLKPGVYCPIPSFFQLDTEDLDLPSFEAHLLRIVQAGVWPLLAGSNGEAIHLSHEERTTLVRGARRTLDARGLTDVPLVVGTGGGSTRETLLLCRAAADAGADYAIVITPGYFAGALAQDREALKEFYREVARKSPIPILLYNFPAASGGIDLDSELITELASEDANIVGVKLTCGNVGKLTRVCATVSDQSYTSKHPRKTATEEFLVLGGYTDFLLPSAYVRGHGAITGLANVAPHSIKKLYDLSVQSLTDPSALLEAQRLQGIVARGDITLAGSGVSGTKSLLQRLYGYGGNPRRPLPPISREDAEALWNHPHIRELVALEKQISGQ